jgi:hypothetical protein
MSQLVKKFCINDYIITMKLYDDKTYIYINDKRFFKNHGISN